MKIRSGFVSNSSSSSFVIKLTKVEERIKKIEKLNKIIKNESKKWFRK
jgi:hypothetical protein